MEGRFEFTWNPSQFSMFEKELRGWMEWNRPCFEKTFGGDLNQILQLSLFVTIQLYLYCMYICCILIDFPGRPLQALGALYSGTSLHVKFLFSFIQDFILRRACSEDGHELVGKPFQTNPLISQHEALQQRLKAAGITARCLSLGSKMVR